MKNSLNLVLVVFLFVVLGCSCPFMKNLNFDDRKTPASPYPTPFGTNPPTSPSPSNTTSSTSSTLTLDKFNQIQKGMSKTQVERILGGAGKQTGSTRGGNSIISTYEWKDEDYKVIYVVFVDDKVSTKTQANLK